MKVNRLLKKETHIQWILLCLFAWSIISLKAQSDNANQDKAFRDQDLSGNLVLPMDDSIAVEELIDRGNKIFFAARDRDSVYYLFHQALQLSKTTSYSRGIAKSNARLGFTFYVENIPDSAKYYLRLAIKKAIELQDYRLLTLYYLWYGWTFSPNLIDLDSQLMSFKMANKYAIQRKDTIYIQGTSENLITTYIRAGKMIEATRLGLELTKIAQIKNDTVSLIRNYLTLGGIFGSMNLLDKQMNMIYAALHVPENFKDTTLLMQVYEAASFAYLDRQKYDSVIYYTTRILSLSQKMTRYYPALQINAWYKIADAFYHTGQLDSAKYYYSLIPAGLKLGQFESFYYAGFGRLADKFNDHDKALEYFKIAEKEVLKGDVTSKAETYRILFEYYEAKGQPIKALKYLKEYKLNEDSIQRNELAFNSEYLMLEFETAKKEEQIRLLSTESEFKSNLARKQKQQKNLAYGGIAMILLAGGFGFHRFRKYKNLKNKQALTSERLRISRDLHDEVGATLSGIVMYSHLAKSQAKNNIHEVEQSLDIVQETASEMVNKLNDVVWLVSPLQDKLENLVERLEEYAQHATSAKEINFQLNTSVDLDRILPIDLRKNIYLFCKEAINNAVKYSEGTLIELSVIRSDHTIEFSIRDNGKGFDPETVKRGNGLNNMQQRADDISADFRIQRDPESGTIVSLKCKITQLRYDKTT